MRIDTPALRDSRIIEWNKFAFPNDKKEKK